MTFSPSKAIIPFAMVTAYMRHKYDSDWSNGILLYFAFFLIYHGYHMFIYEQFLSPLSKIPGPKGYWFLGVIELPISTEPREPYLSWLEKYGDSSGFISLPFCFGTRLMATSKDFVSRVLEKTNIYVRPSFEDEVLRIIFQDGLLVSKGSDHTRQRMVLTPSFNNIRKFMFIFLSKAEELVNTISAQLKQRSLGSLAPTTPPTRRDDDTLQSIGAAIQAAVSRLFGRFSLGAPRSDDTVDGGIEILQFLSDATFDIIGSAVFGDEFNSLDKESFLEAYAILLQQIDITKLFNIATAFFPSLRKLPFPSVLKVSAAQKSMVEQVTKLVHARNERGIAENERGIVENDIFSFISGEPRLVDQCITLLLAGYETTSTALAWALHILAQHPEVQSRLRDEVRHLSLDQIVSCKYLDYVCREILRFIPPVGITNRVANVTDEINGVRIPEGTIIFIPISAINSSKTMWGDDAGEFKPDRWEKQKEIPDHLTFLRGPRSCIGRKFAETEMKVLLAMLLRSFKFDEVVKGRPMETVTLITTKPKNLYLKISAV